MKYTTKNKCYRTLLLLIAMMCCLGAGAQKKTVKWAEIEANPNLYIYGRGTSTNEREANELAKQELVSSISTSVASSFSRTFQQTNSNGNLDDKMAIQSVLNTYSEFTGLTGLTFVTIENKKGQITKGCYITREHLNEIFEERGNKALNYAEEAFRQERSGMVGSALRNYYWAYALLCSYPEGDKKTMQDEDKHTQVLTQWIPEEMARICKNIKVKSTSREVDEDGATLLTLKVTYTKGSIEAAAKDLTIYASGNDMAETLVDVNDGVAELELPEGVKEKKISIKVDYMGGTSVNCSPELASAVKLVQDLSIRNSTLKLETAIEKKPETLYAAAQAPSPMFHTDMVRGHGPSPQEEITNRVEVYQQNFMKPAEAAPHIQVAKKIEDILRQRRFSQLQSMCTPEAWEIADKLFNKYGTARLVGHPNVQFMENKEGVAIRSFPMAFQFRKNNRKTTENVVFHLNHQGQICHIAFALETAAVEDILTQGEWPQVTRQVIIDFLEGYKTSFATKDVGYIERVFSDEALIIMGHFVKTRARSENSVQLKDAKAVEYTRYSKNEYIEHMRKVFGSQEFVNVKFGDNRIKQGGYTNRITKQRKPMYGIQIKQDYFSTTYGDTGYLFLLVDLEKPAEPVIHVRTWQPYKDVRNDIDPEGSYGDKIFGIEDFN